MKEPQLRRIQALLVIVAVVATACGSTAQPGAAGPAGAADQGLGLDAEGIATADDGMAMPGELGAPGELLPDGTSDAAAPAAGGASGSDASVPGGGVAAGGAPAAEGGDAPAPPAGSPGSGSQPGLTATEIHIGMAYAENADAVNDAAGVEGATDGDGRRMAEIMIKWVNDNGGVFGRKVVPVFHVYDGASAQTVAQQEQAACATYTQDNEVFAALAIGEPTLNSCLHQAGVPQFNVQGMRGSQEDVIAQWPRYFEITHVELNTVARSQIEGLHDKGYFKPRTAVEAVKVGLVRYDETGFKRAATEAFIPALKRRGLTLHAQAEISAPQAVSDLSGVGAQIQNAILRFRRQGINRVMFMEKSGDLALLWMNAAESQSYRPRYGLTSNDAGELLAANVPHAQLEDAMGVGWTPEYDTLERYAPKAWPARKLCRKIFAASGYEFSDMNEESVAMQACDEMWFLQAAAAASPSGATREGIVAGAERLGTSYRSAGGTGRTRFSPKRHWGVTEYRNLAWITDCECFQYTSGLRQMPD